MELYACCFSTMQLWQIYIALGAVSIFVLQRILKLYQCVVDTFQKTKVSAITCSTDNAKIAGKHIQIP